MLKSFQTILGLKVSYFKTCMVGVNVEENVLIGHADMMGCSIGRWPIKYLGMPLGGNPRVVAFWDLVVEKVFKRLASWKRSNISLGGKITLIKGALSNILVYYMSLFKMPIKVGSAIKKLQRDFL